MLVKFLKDHLRHNKGDVSDILPDAANYFIKCGVAESYTKPVKIAPVTEIIRKPVDREKILKSTKKK